MLPSSVRGRYRLLMALGALLAVGWVLWLSRDALAPFLVGVVVAFVLAPMVDRVASWLPFRETRPDLALTLSVAVVYLASLLLFLLLGLMVAVRVGEQLDTLATDAPRLVERARLEFERNAEWYRENVPEEVQRRINERTQELADRASDIGLTVATRTVSLVTGGVTGLLGYIVVPFWIFYVLKDRARGASAFYSMFPASVRDDVRTVLHRANAVFGSYIRAQLLLSAVSGLVTWLGLSLLGVRFSLGLGVINGFANLIPVLGPMLGGIPVLVVTLATEPGPKVFWVFLFLFVAQNLKDYVLVPRVQGDAVKLHPAIILVLLVIAGHIAGFWGLLLVVPVAAVIRDTFVHIYRRLGEEPAASLPETAP